VCDHAANTAAVPQLDSAGLCVRNEPLSRIGVKGV